MSIRINSINRIVFAISIQIQTQRIFIFASKAIPWNEPTNTRIIVSCSKVYSAGFSIIIFAAVTERIFIGINDILLNAESVILVSLSYFAVGICEIYNIAVSVLGIIGILRFCAVAVVVLGYKICAANVAVSLIELIVNYVCNNLLISVPDNCPVCLIRFTEQNSL